MKDLQPYLDYFAVLRTYAEQGLLEVLPAANEAYIVDHALYTLSYIEDLAERVRRAEREIDRIERQRLFAEMFPSITVTTSHIRTYAAFLNANEEGFRQYQEASEAAKDTPATKKAVEQAAENMRKPQIVNCKSSNCKFQEVFALHVVSDRERHPLLYTILATKCRRWYTPWKKSDHYEVITY